MSGRPRGAPAVVVMGVSGSGKTTVGRLLAERLGWAFVDADDLHPPENRAKMASGEGLTDADRDPWLDRVRATIEAHLAAGEPVVLACSALRQAYRQRIRGEDLAVAFVWLDVPPDELERRLAERDGHFAGTDLLPSQLDAFEPPAPTEAVRVLARDTAAATAAAVGAALARGGAPDTA